MPLRVSFRHDLNKAIFRANQKGAYTALGAQCPYPKRSILSLAWADGQRFRRLTPFREAAKAKMLAAFGAAGPCRSCNGSEFTEAPFYGPRCSRCKGTGVESRPLCPDDIKGWLVRTSPDSFYSGLYHWELVPILHDGSEEPSTTGGAIGGDEQAALQYGRSQLTARGLKEIQTCVSQAPQD